jgi:hypothetical protein
MVQSAAAHIIEPVALRRHVFPLRDTSSGRTPNDVLSCGLPVKVALCPTTVYGLTRVAIGVQALQIPLWNEPVLTKEVKDATPTFQRMGHARVR